MRELANYVKQVASKMLVLFTRNKLFKNSSLQALISSTRNATLKKTSRVSSTPNAIFFENYALVYAKHYFCSAQLAGLGTTVPLRRPTIPKNKCSRLREMTLFKTCHQKLSKTLSEIACEKYRCRPVHVKRYLFLKTCISPTPNTTFCH